MKLDFGPEGNRILNEELAGLTEAPPGTTLLVVLVLMLVELRKLREELRVTKH